jgi:Zinc knuckle
MIKCHICAKTGHIAKDCKQFFKIKGNLKQYFKKNSKESDESGGTQRDQLKEDPLVVSLATSGDRLPEYLEDIYAQQNRISYVQFNSPSKELRDSVKKTEPKAPEEDELNPAFKQPKFEVN